jgi:hypothetical protein
MTFEQMLALANEVLRDIHTAPAGLPSSQVTLLVSATGQIYTAPNDTTGAVLNELNGDTHIIKLLTLWKSGEVDVPAHTFRTALLAADPKNRETQVLLQGEEGYIVKSLGTLV